MLAVILKILSVLGIMLLCLLGLVLVLVILILVLPLRYSLEITKYPEKELKASFRLTYFFHIIRVYADYEKKLIVKAKVLWINVFSLEIPDSSKNDEEEYDLSDLDEALDDLEEEFNDQEIYVNQPADDNNDSKEDIAEISAEDDHLDIDEEPLNNDSDEKEDEFSDTIFDKIKFKVREFCDKIDKVKSEYRYYRNVINSNEAAYALRKLKISISKLLKMIFPRKIKAVCRFGFSSPDKTGKVYGLYCMFIRRFLSGSDVKPDFENEIFEGFVKAKGYFNLFSVLMIGISFILNKNVRKIWKSIKHHKAKNEQRSEKVEYG